MTLKSIMNYGIAIIVAMTFCLPLVAQEKADPSPFAGTWKWERDGLNGKVHCELFVKESDDELTGTYKDADEVEAKVDEIAFRDGVVSFKLVMENEGKTSKVLFTGKLKNGKISGKMKDSRDKEREWKASRITSLADAAGTWRMDFTTPDGTTRNPEFELKEKDGKASLKFNVQEENTGDAKVSNIEFEDGVLTFDVALDFNGQELQLTYEMEIMGDELEGSMRFEFAEIPEQNGEVDITGTRIK